MRKETAKNFWRRAIRMLTYDQGRVVVPNPAVTFTLDVKAGEFDEIDDENFELSPRLFYNVLNQRIYGQEDAKKATSMIMYNHLEGRRSTAVFCGPSGCGKTEIWRDRCTR